MRVSTQAWGDEGEEALWLAGLCGALLTGLSVLVRAGAERLRREVETVLFLRTLLLLLRFSECVSLGESWLDDEVHVTSLSRTILS